MCMIEISYLGSEVKKDIYNLDQYNAHRLARRYILDPIVEFVEVFDSDHNLDERYSKED